MCGRYTTSLGASIREAVGAVLSELKVEDAALLDAPPRYNVAPTQDAPVVLNLPGGPTLASLRWGLVPPWAKDESIGNRMINARSETAADKPAYREALRRRRCLVPASGFYEWRKVAHGPKVPHHFRPADDDPEDVAGGVLMIAGLWERRGELRTFTILTGEPNALVRPVYDRMPVVLPSNQWAAWLSPKAMEGGEAAGLLGVYPAGRMRAVAVSTAVNVPSAEGKALVEPAGDG